MTNPAHAPTPASRSGISHARARWGVLPIIRLFRSVCRPLASPTLRGAWCFGLRTMALDSSQEEVADTAENERVFGRHRGRYGSSAFPQLLGIYLVECGTRAIVDADIRGCHGSIHRAAQRLLRSITAGMLLLWDSGFHSYALAAAIRARGAHFLGRVPAGQTFELVRILRDGSMLARFYAACPSSRTTSTPSVLVRVLTYTITDPARPGYGTIHRLMTSLLDPAVAPTAQVIAAYHERWEIELALDEIDTHLRLAPGPFQSKTPRGVVQELYGLLLAHYAVRALIAQAALPAGLDPDRISFVGAVRLVGTTLPLMPILPPAVQEQVKQALLVELARHDLPPRRSRSAPRARKCPRSKHPIRRRGTSYATTVLPPFGTTVCLLPPAPRLPTKQKQAPPPAAAPGPACA